MTTAEIMSALEKHGATNIVEIRLKEKIDTIGDVVIATGASRRHLKKMAETIVAAVGAQYKHVTHYPPLIVSFLLLL